MARTDDQFKLRNFKPDELVSVSLVGETKFKKGEGNPRQFKNFSLIGPIKVVGKQNNPKVISREQALRLRKDFPLKQVQEFGFSLGQRGFISKKRFFEL